MQYKSYIIEEDIDVIKESLVLFYGENLGLQNDIKSLINTFNNLKYKNNLMIDWSSVEIKLKKLIWQNYFQKLNEHITKD